MRQRSEVLKGNRKGKKEDMSTQNLIMHVVIPQRNISKNKNRGDNSLKQFIIFVVIVTGNTYLDVFTRQENVIWGGKKIKLVKQAKTAQTNTKETQKEPKITVLAQSAKFQQC